MRVTVCTVAWGRMEGFWSKYALRSLEWDLGELGSRAEVRKFGSFRELVEDSVSHGLTFYTAPDQIWGKGSLVNLMRVAEIEPNGAFAVPHFRVNDNKLMELLDENPLPLEAPDLLEIAYRARHQNFYDTFIDNQPNIRHAGISSHHITKSIIALQHSLPTIVLLKMSDWDRDLFRRCEYNVQEWDRLFLSSLVKSYRYFCIGSSDLACMVEMTERNGHVVGVRDNSSSRFVAEQEHNAMCRQTIYVLRRNGNGEEQFSGSEVGQEDAEKASLISQRVLRNTQISGKVMGSD